MQQVIVISSNELPSMQYLCSKLHKLDVHALMSHDKWINYGF